MLDLSEKAVRVLMAASRDTIKDIHGNPVWLIKRTLGYKTWATGGQSGKRADVAELYRHGLIAEFHSPWSPLCYLTKAGESEFRMRGGD